MRKDNEKTSRVMKRRDGKKYIVKARGYELSNKYVMHARIRGVHNVSGDFDYIDDAYIDDLVARVCNVTSGEVCIVETSVINKGYWSTAGALRVVSVIVFADSWAMDRHMLRYKELYFTNKSSGIYHILN